MPPIRTTSRTENRLPDSAPAGILCPSASSLLAADWPFAEEREKGASVSGPVAGYRHVTSSVAQVVSVGHGVRTHGFVGVGVGVKSHGGASVRPALGDITMGANLPVLAHDASSFGLGVDVKSNLSLKVAELPSSSDTPWFDVRNRNVTEQLNYTIQTALHDEIVAFTNYIQPCQLECEAHQLVVKRLDMIAKKMWLPAEVRMQGSAALALVLPEGDIDTVLLFRGRKNEGAKMGLLCALEPHLKSKGIAESVEVGTAGHSGMPMLTLKTTKEYGSLHINMRVETQRDNDLRVVPRVNEYFGFMPALRPLVLVLKSFVFCKEVDSDLKGGLSTYALVCMCISFLQLNPIRLAPCALSSPFTEKSLGSILLAFLEYYADGFPYETAVISVRTGMLLTKEQKLWYVNNPQEKDLLSIECMVDPGKDIGQSCAKIREIRALFKQAARTLRTGNVGSTLLGRLIQVDQITDTGRKDTRDLVRSGKLQALVASGLPRARLGSALVLPALEGSDWAHTSDRTAASRSRARPRQAPRSRYNPYARKENSGPTRRPNRFEEMLKRYEGLRLSSEEPMVL